MSVEDVKQQVSEVALPKAKLVANNMHAVVGDTRTTAHNIETARKNLEEQVLPFLIKAMEGFDLIGKNLLEVHTDSGVVLGVMEKLGDNAVKDPVEAGMGAAREAIDAINSPYVEAMIVARELKATTELMIEGLPGAAGVLNENANRIKEAFPPINNAIDSLEDYRV